MDRRVVLVFHQVAERVTDGGRLEQSRRELVQQRLERVVVVLVDDDDVDVGTLQLPRCADPGEAAAENEDALTRVRGRRPPTPTSISDYASLYDPRAPSSPG